MSILSALAAIRPGRFPPTYLPLFAVALQNARSLASQMTSTALCNLQYLVLDP